MLLLYPEPGNILPTVILHLHSTMLLLYLRVRGSVVVRGAVFTFHYASTLSRVRRQKWERRTRIYIPLCFYFIRCDMHIHEAVKNLHSTMLLLYLFDLPHQCRAVISFTFHYASTLSITQKYVVL